MLSNGIQVLTNGRLHLPFGMDCHLNSSYAGKLVLGPCFDFTLMADGRHFYHVAEEHLIVRQMVEYIYQLQANVVAY